MAGRPRRSVNTRDNVRMRIIKRWYAGEPLEEICWHCKVREKTVYNIVKAYEAKVDRALYPGNRFYRNRARRLAGVAVD